VIPIENLYYLLCYAWNNLDEKDYVDVAALPQQDLPNLLARILASGAERLLRRGIDRSYFAQQDDTQSPRGKIDLSETLKRSLLIRNQVACATDELSANTLHNRIIRATLARLSSTSEVAPILRKELGNLAKRFEPVSLLELRPINFANVQLHRNNAFYRFLLDVCEICFFSLLASEKTGEYRFRDFIRDEVRMRKVFHDFIYNFFRLEQGEFSVSSERIKWDITAADNNARHLLPDMYTDVCLDSQSRKIVIECKFTPDALNEHRGKISARSTHLYQLFAYLKHLESRGGANEHCEGLLIYPVANDSVDFMFDTQGHTVRVLTLDLRRGWPEIRKQLLSLVKPWKQVHAA
jgi:5-methylcytosine-specific restriction enzyme subunit McrC